MRTVTPLPELRSDLARRVPVLAYLLGACALGSVPAAGAQTSVTPTANHEWADYDLVQFVTVAGSGPSSVLALDDNGRLALLAEHGVDENALRTATGASASQIELLRTWGLVERRGDSVWTTFPILDTAETRALRAATRTAGQRVTAAIAPDVQRLVDELSKSDRTANAYSILFSYVLDGLTWREWEEDGAIETRELTVAHPFWSGHIWAVQPEREALVGTNRVSDERGALYVSWSHAAIPALGRFITDFGKVVDLFERFADRTPVEPELRAEFAPYGLFDDHGFFTIPIIEARPGDPVHEVSLRIASRITELVPSVLDLRGLRLQFGFASDTQALVVAYHELMWDILAELAERGLVRRPGVLDGESRDPGEVAALIFGVRPLAGAECSDIANAIERTLCFADRAVEAGSTSPCDEASREGVRYQCYAVYAERAETVEPCRRIPTTSGDLRDLRDVCVGDVAEVTGRAELCAEVAADGLRDSCWLSVYRRTGDRTLCDRIEDRALKSLCTDEPVRIE